MAKQKPGKQAITMGMTLGEIAARWPKAVPVMYKYGMHCPTCPVAASESLEAGASVHGLSKQQIDKMVKEMNEIIKK